MNARIHDEEFDTSETVVRALLAEQVPDLADHALEALRSTGTSNALWRVTGRDGSSAALVRLPRTAGAVRSLESELDLLPALATTGLVGLVAIPRLLHAGDPGDAFGQRWAITDWVDGEDAWEARERVTTAGPRLACDLAAVVDAIGAVSGLSAPARKSGRRGGPLGPLLDVIDHWLTDDRWRAVERLDVAAIRRLVDEARELVDEPVPARFLHGDLIPGNLLVDERGRLQAVIDWGGAGDGDPADDLVAAWAVFDGDARLAFRHALRVDDATWLRARTFALEQAIGGVLYYVPRRHPLGDVMQRTLDRILASP